MNIETWFGTFYEGEGVEVSETGLLGETRIVRGFVREKRYPRGPEYLVIDGEDGCVYEIPLRGGNLDYIRRAEIVSSETPMSSEEEESTKTPSYQSKYTRTR